MTVFHRSMLSSHPQITGARVAVTPSEEEEEFVRHEMELFNDSSGKTAIVPGKRANGPPVTARHITVESPLKSPRSYAMSGVVAATSTSQQQAQRVIDHAADVKAYVEATRQAILPVYQLFKPRDLKRTDQLTRACRDRTAAQVALTMSIKNLSDFLSQEREHVETESSYEDLMLKLHLAVAAGRETTENVRAIAEGLTKDLQYGDALNEKLQQLRNVHANGEHLFAAGALSSAPAVVTERSLLSCHEKEALQIRIQAAQATFQYTTELIPSVIDTAHRFFQGFRDDSTMSNYGDQLHTLHKQLNAEILLMKIAIHQAEQHASKLQPEEDRSILQALDVTMCEVTKLTEQMREIVQHADGYDEVSMVDVPALFQMSAEIHDRYQDSLQALVWIK